MHHFSVPPRPPPGPGHLISYLILLLKPWALLSILNTVARMILLGHKSETFSASTSCFTHSQRPSPSSDGYKTPRPSSPAPSSLPSPGSLPLVPGHLAFPRVQQACSCWCLRNRCSFPGNVLPSPGLSVARLSPTFKSSLKNRILGEEGIRYIGVE